MYKIGIIQNIHEDGIKLLENNKNFVYEIIDDVSEDNLLKKIHLYDGISLRTAKLSNNILSKASRLKVISRHGVGYDNVDVNFLKKKYHSFDYSHRKCNSYCRTCFLSDVNNLKKLFKS